METVSGIVARVTYQNSENGYSVMRVEPTSSTQSNLFDKEHDSEERITVTGNLALLKAGDVVDFTGEWTNHAKYGTQFTVDSFHIHSPTTKIGLTKFLASDHFKGIGEKLAQELIDTFGESLPQVIEHDHHKLTAIRGITRQKSEIIKEAWEKAKDTREQNILLQGMGLTPNLTHKVIDMYGAKAAEKITENPYQLAQDVWGVGFKRADEIGKNIGFTHDHAYRISAGISYSLIKALDDGHMFLPFEELTNQAQQILSVDLVKVEGQIQAMLTNGVLVLDRDVSYNAIYLKAFHKAEDELATLLQKLDEPHDDDPFAKVPLKEISGLLESAVTDTALSSEQAMAVKTALTNPVSILTGGPGTGKSTTLNTLIKILEEVGKSYVLTAPTGRAAKRLAEISDRTSYTVHRLLKLQPGEVAAFNAEDPLKYDIVIVDEVSMLDTFVMKALIAAVKPGSHIFLVGDADQLPSVQAGNVLSDIIHSKRFPVVTLTQVFRQAQESDIIMNAHRIKEGMGPEFKTENTDFYFIEVDTVEDARASIVDLVSNRIPTEFGFNPYEDIQVLAPLYKTPAGVSQLNIDLQQTLNPKKRGKNEIPFGYTMFREGDRVMQLKNNYEKDVFNGDVGIVRDISVFDGSPEVSVSFGSGYQVHTVKYAREELMELTLAYAASVHKSQGSEYPVVVMPMVTSHYIMLQRNLLYTGITRAKNLVMLVGQKKALYMALKNDTPMKRYSGLKKRLER